MECARLQNTPTTATTLIHCHCAINFNADKLEATVQKGGISKQLFINLAIYLMPEIGNTI
jgi:hypothetical protein